MKRAIPELIGMGQLQREATRTIRRIAHEGQEAFIVSHNKPQAVLLSLRRYQELRALEEAKQKEEGEVLAIIARGDEEFALGKTVTKKSLRHLL
ncbi:MAG: hypothetical protein HYV03_06570 [Deltaproteobacteria bacterium]|nr:hypothetical protein [Deltaproteobacteria bacterium]